jgi:hypothetical protein
MFKKLSEILFTFILFFAKLVLCCKHHNECINLNETIVSIYTLCTNKYIKI